MKKTPCVEAVRDIRKTIDLAPASTVRVRSGTASALLRRHDQALDTSWSTPLGNPMVETWKPSVDGQFGRLRRDGKNCAKLIDTLIWPFGPNRDTLVDHRQEQNRLRKSTHQGSRSTADLGVFDGSTVVPHHPVLNVNVPLHSCPQEQNLQRSVPNRRRASQTTARPNGGADGQGHYMCYMRQQIGTRNRSSLMAKDSCGQPFSCSTNSPGRDLLGCAELRKRRF